MQRQDIVAAYHAKALFTEHTEALLYLLNRTYQPFYKWSFRGCHAFAEDQDIVNLLEQLVQTKITASAWDKPYRYYQNHLNETDANVFLIESISKKVVARLQSQMLTDQDEVFLQAHLESIRSRITDPAIRELHVMEGI